MKLQNNVVLQCGKADSMFCLHTQGGDYQALKTLYNNRAFTLNIVQLDILVLKAFHPLLNMVPAA